MAQQDIRVLLEKLHNGQLTPEEEKIVRYWLLKLNQDEPANLSKKDLDSISQEMWTSLEGLTRKSAKTVTLSLWPRIAAAASIIVILSAGGYLLFKNKPAKQQATLTAKNDIAPGHNQATLTLANGKKIILTRGLSGQLAMQNHTVIQATQNHIVYNATNQTGTEISYNTLSTAQGEQSPYPLVLADGTKVWLDACSSITFPTAFPGKERVVKVTGEAYFEVKHNAGQPFKVETNGQTIEDIGTIFNVNAYGDEPQALTTLVQGAIKVNGKLLQPGQQAIVNGGHIRIADANIETVTAWKDGQFVFDDQDMEVTMRQLARWYGVTIAYAPDAPRHLRIGGEISRDRKLSTVLTAMQQTHKVKFEINGRTITVSR